MSKLMSFGICCLGISIWGAIQLSIMGILYKVEAVTLLEDAEAEEFADPIEFIQLTEKNYSALARNCWICAVLYLITIGVSIACIKKAKKIEKLKQDRLDDDELMCVTPDVSDIVVTESSYKAHSSKS